MSRVELTDFLLARVAEDEAKVRECLAWVENAPSLNNCATHHDPARVLAECEAKRRIVEFAKSSGREREYTHRQVGATFTQKAVSMAIGMTYSSVLRFLALPYADHPDWREEWRP